ncbi:MarR family winged helix-turn-helix transcriptional regulator [Paenibacillus herberti]|uniref:MarR family transcriptional regulator n=1 Tax=Paenibacillus herberti TaxID=1619309 RepID=A0A229NVX3_9BACL|nr:MarR family transcriptional regulator [Paenibacillus herberti]OXM14018.1 MarR family transcriptional regulator [Paenibacillus herberti]
MEVEIKRFHLAAQAFMQTMELSMQETIKESGMTRTQLLVLHLIKKHAPCKLAVIAEKMEAKPSAITVMMDRLENGGYVRRRHDTVDRRAIFVEITEEGEKVMQWMRQQKEKMIGVHLSKLTAEELHTITLILEKLTVGED